MMTADPTTPYLLGHSDDELDRLERQARFFDAETTSALVQAGVGAGARVLDLGCGAGDVSIAAARLVGSSGQVIGLDTSPEAVALSNRRFAHHGLTWAASRLGDAWAIGESGFDAVVGRFILMHMADPAALLRHLRDATRPGGLIAFVEMDISSATITPPMPLFERGVQAIVDVYRAWGSQPDMGSRLYAAFRQAGLKPALRGSCRVEGGPAAEVYDYLARSVVSLSGAMRERGIALPHADLGTYAVALKDEAARSDYCVAHPRVTAAWATVDG